jgi:hypothetical protein
MPEHFSQILTGGGSGESFFQIGLKNFFFLNLVYKIDIFYKIHLKKKKKFNRNFFNSSMLLKK